MFVHAVCLWTRLIWWLAVLSFVDKYLVDICARFERCDCLWTFASISLAGALGFFLGSAVALHPVTNLPVSDTWSPADKVALVLMQSSLFLTFSFTSQCLLFLCYLDIHLHCSHFAVTFLLLRQHNFFWQPPTDFVGSHSFATGFAFICRCITST